MVGSNGVNARTITSTTIGCYDVCSYEGGEVVLNDDLSEWQDFLGGYVTEEIAPGYRCYFGGDERFEKVRIDDYVKPASYQYDAATGYAKFIDLGCYLSGGEIREVVDGESREEVCVWEDATEGFGGCRFEFIDENGNIACDDKCSPFNAFRLWDDRKDLGCWYTNFNQGGTKTMLIPNEAVVSEGDEEERAEEEQA